MDQNIVISKKQFIAGAVCPACQALDRIVVEIAAATDCREELSRRRCVVCGFADDFGATQQPAARTIPRGRPERTETPATAPMAVRIVDPGERSVD